ncbi:MAG TPA: helix-turn-helix domain-containing protein [Mycobacterium sp.]|nr:helix-turn-helix domain-containing protein [Mycobacterium sp.]
MTERGVIPPAERKRLRATERRLGEADTEMRAAVQAAHQAGGSIRSIAAEIGRSTRTIQNWLRTAPADPHG